MIANLSEPYSTLNPDTSSDSPSAKSKGARFNSAIIVINQGLIKILIGKIKLDICLFKVNSIRLIVSHVIAKDKIIKASEIS
jgi:hypothetical protein